MTPQVEISTEGALGVITLNRPEAINALNREMIDGITETLTAWRGDAGVRLVLFEGRGPRGFCSGGDVRAARQLVLEGAFDAADAYFAAEYALNGMISTYPKPIAAIGHGAVMGGGIGIFGHCRYRFALPESRFAMPEAAIGFMSDVGVNALLAQVPEARALAFLMAGLPVGTGDALTLGLCDAAIEAARVEALRADLVRAADSADIDAAIVRVMEAESIEAGPPVFSTTADALSEAFAAATAEEIVAAVAALSAAEPAFMPLSRALGLRSPTSLEAIVVSHRAARHNPGIDAVLALDLRLARFMIHQPDFAEGVRAVLVDKDQAPRWRPAALEASGRAAIAAASLP